MREKTTGATYQFKARKKLIKTVKSNFTCTVHNRDGVATPTITIPGVMIDADPHTIVAGEIICIRTAMISNGIYKERYSITTIISGDEFVSCRCPEQIVGAVTFALAQDDRIDYDLAKISGNLHIEIYTRQEEQVSPSPEEDGDEDATDTPQEEN